MTEAGKRPVLHLICGLPGSGKTTLGKRLEQAGDGVRFSPDEWLHHLGIDFYDAAGRERVEALQWTLARQLLARRQNVILENGFWSKAERDSYRAAAEAIGAVTRVHFLDVPLATLKDRLARRNRVRDAATPEVDPASLDDWAALFEVPTDDELDRQ